VRAALVLCLLAGVTAAHAQTPRPARPAGADRVLTVVNHSRHAITQLFVSSSTTDDWGQDRLTGTPIAPGASAPIRLGRVPDCTYDIQAVYDDASTEEQRSFDICHPRPLAFDGSSATDPGPMHAVSLLNGGPRKIEEVYISSPTANGWGEDLLGDRAIAPGGRGSLQFRGDCTADLRIVFDNESAEERRAFDLCRHAALTIAPGWTTVEDAAAPADTTPEEKPAVLAGDAVTIVNGSGRGITALYLVRDGEAGPGHDRLGSDTLPDGERKRLEFDRSDGCRFTLRVVYSDSTPDQQRAGVDLCQSPEITITGGQGVLITGLVGRIRNGGASPIVALYADLPGTPQGADRLGDRVIGVGQSTTLEPPVPGQCRFQLRAQFRDGPQATATADLCKGEEITLK